MFLLRFVKGDILYTCLVKGDMYRSLLVSQASVRTLQRTVTYNYEGQSHKCILVVKQSVSFVLS